MSMKTPTGNPLEIYLAFDPEKHWRVIESDTAPFIADDKNPEWYIKLSEFDAAQARIAALEATLSSIALDCQGASVCGEPEMGLETIYHKASEALAAREVAK